VSGFEVNRIAGSAPPSSPALPERAELLEDGVVGGEVEGATDLMQRSTRRESGISGSTKHVISVEPSL